MSSEDDVKDPELAMVMAIAPPNLFRDYFCIFIKYNKYKAAAILQAPKYFTKKTGLRTIKSPYTVLSNNKNYNTEGGKKRCLPLNTMTTCLNPPSLPKIHLLSQYSQTDHHTCQNWNNAF